MLFEQVWIRFRTDWPAFAAMGVGTVLGLMAAAGAATLLWRLAGAQLGAVSLAAVQQFEPLGWGSVTARLAAQLLLAAAGMAPFLALAAGGLVGSLVIYRQGERPNLALFWTCARHQFPAMLGLVIANLLLHTGYYLAVRAELSVAQMALVGLLAQPLLLLNVGLYPAYLMVAEGRTVSGALFAGWIAVRRKGWESVTAALVLNAFSMVMGAVSTVWMLPLVGWPLYLGALCLYLPLMGFYFIERFETYVRPGLWG